MIVIPINEWFIKTFKNEFTFKPNKEYEVTVIQPKKIGEKTKYWIWYDKSRGQKAIITSKELFNKIFKIKEL